MLSIRLKLDCTISPFVAVSGIIVALMLAGMAGILFPMVCALYALGFAGIVYAIAKRHAPPRPLILALLAFLIFLVWRFYFCPLWHSDDISHWGLVARHLLRYDRFPSAGDDYVFFQNYPLGAACFIYYVGRITENSEGVYLIAQNFLLGALYLPMFSLIRKRRNVLYPLCAAFFFLLFHYFRHVVGLQVDALLGFFSIGMAAAIVRYRNDLRRALTAVLPAMAAVIYIKNSGLFFALLAAAMLMRASRRRDVRRRAWLGFALIAVTACAFLLWELYTKLAFPNALATKHAVSLAAYARQGMSKSPSVIAQIALRQLRSMFSFHAEKRLAMLVLPLCAILLFYASRMLADPRRRQIRADFFRAVGVYLVWYLLVFLMYVFSMPSSEALLLGGMYRYNGTGLTCLMGMTAILLFELFQEADPLPGFTRWVSRLCPLFIAGMIALTAWPGGARLDEVFERNTRPSDFRAALQQLRADGTIADGSQILGYWTSMVSNDTADFAYYAIKYEFETDDILLIASDDHYPGLYIVGARQGKVQPEDVLESASSDASLPSLVGLTHGVHVCLPLADVSNFVAKNIDAADAFLILGDSEDFEARIAPVLDSYDGNTPVYRFHLRSLKR